VCDLYRWSVSYRDRFALDSDVFGDDEMNRDAQIYVTLLWYLYMCVCIYIYIYIYIYIWYLELCTAKFRKVFKVERRLLDESFPSFEQIN
jgi:hypothetical protein